MFGELGLPELLIILVIIVLVFGVGRINNIAGELGKGIRAFKTGLKGDEKSALKPSQARETGEPDPGNKND